METVGAVSHDKERQLETQNAARVARVLASQHLGSKMLRDMPRAGSSNDGQGAREVVAQWSGLTGRWRGKAGRRPAAHANASRASALPPDFAGAAHVLDVGL